MFLNVFYKSLFLKFIFLILGFFNFVYKLN
ncbi:hypothetical protein V461_04195 [Pantoea ananatis BRT98]|nr:hypothetical protein V461_04195 [Pantoea ananatis BRT98]